MLAVIAPYDRSETCLAAVRLAEQALSAGRVVRYLTPDRCLRGIHPYWDAQVRSLRGGVAEHCRGVTRAVWFTGGENLISEVGYYGHKVRHVYVPALHNMYLAEWTAAAGTSHVVYPTAAARQCGSAILHMLRGHDAPEQSVCAWSTAFKPYVRRSRSRADQRVLVYCDTHSVDDCAALVCRAVVELVRALPTARVHVLSAKTWSRRDRKLLRDVCAQSDGRVSHTQQQGIVDVLTLMLEADWLVLPGVRANFGLLVSHANAFGLPVVCYDVDPYSELVTDGHNGVLVPCETYANSLGVPSAIPSAVAFARRLIDSVGDVRKYNHMRSGDWRLEEADQEFGKFWAHQLD